MYTLVISIIALSLCVAYLAWQNRLLKNQVNHKYKEINVLKSQRTELVANVSHDLKTPLTSVRGYAETLRDGALEDPEAAKKFLSRILESSNQMIELIEDILQLSRLEATNAHLKIEEINISELFHKLEQKFSFLIHRSEQSLKFHSEAKVFRADLKMVERALSNLIENAHRYCDEGVTIKVDAKNISNGESWVEFSISDNGPGIAQQDLDRIFERFYRGEKSRHRQFGGSGLGLAIVKHIMISHGGQIHVNSKLHQGTTFHLYFPK